MIQPLQANSISFKSTELSPALKAKLAAQNSQVNDVNAQKEQPKKSFSVTETYQKGKKGITNIFKGVNNVAGVTGGVAKGVAAGSLATLAFGVVGKAVSESKDLNGLEVLTHIVGETIKDTAKGVWEAVKFVPSVITKSPLENIKTIGSLPKKFYTTYLKGHKRIAIAATAIGLGVLAYNAIKGKIKANEKNADLDHKTNLGHV